MKISDILHELAKETARIYTEKGGTPLAKPYVRVSFMREALNELNSECLPKMKYGQKITADVTKIEFDEALVLIENINP